MVLHFSPPSAASGHVELPLILHPTTGPPSLLPNPGTAHGSFLLSHIMIPLCFQTADPLSSQIA